MKKRFVFGVCMFIGLASQAQHVKEDVMVVVNQLFHAMETNDGELAGSLFTNDATLRTVNLVDGEYGEISSIPYTKLVEVFAGRKEKIYSEPIWNERVTTDGPYTVVLVDYAFYLKNAFHHCGVDMFELVLTESGWKIFGVTDTRRQEGCEVPKKIKARYKK